MLQRVLSESERDEWSSRQESQCRGRAAHRRMRRRHTPAVCSARGCATQPVSETRDGLR